MQHEALWEPNCVVDETAVLDAGVRLWNWVRVREHVIIQAGTVCGDYVHIGPHVLIGRGCRIGNGAQVHEAANIGDRVFLGPNAFIGNDRTPMAGKDWECQSVTICDDVVVGAGAKIMGGVRVGAGAIIGMGAVILDDVPPGVVVRGMPGKPNRLRVQHYPGTAHEHWAPYGEADGCPLCKEWGLEPPPFVPLQPLPSEE